MKSQWVSVVWTFESHCRCGIYCMKYVIMDKMFSELYIYFPGLQQKDVLCDLCGQAFSAKNQMQRHRMIHNEAYRQRFKCIYCTYNTYTRPNIRRHMLSVHKDLPYEEITSDFAQTAQDS